MEAGPQGPPDQGSARLGAGRTEQPELPLNWNSAKSKHYLEWWYRHCDWKPRDQNLIVDQRPRTARPNRGRRPNSGAKGPGLNCQPQTSWPERPLSSPSRRPVSSLSNRQGSACATSKQSQSAQAGTGCQKRDANVDSDNQIHDDETRQKLGEVTDAMQPGKLSHEKQACEKPLMLPCKLGNEEPTQKRHLLSSQTSSATGQLEALALQCVDEVSAVEQKMRCVLSIRCPKPGKLMARHEAYKHQKSGDLTPRAPAGKHVDIGLPEETDHENKRTAMFKTRPMSAMDETMSASASHKRLTENRFGETSKTALFTMSSSQAARFALSAGRALVANYNSSLDPTRMRKRSSRRGSVGSPKGGSPFPRTPSKSKNRTWRTGRSGGAAQQKASLRSEAEEVKSRIQTVFASTAADVREVESVKQQTLTQWELHQIAIQLAFPVTEVQYAKKVFDELDTDQNGSLDYMEFEKASVKLVGEESAEREVRRICREVWTAIADAATKTIGFQAFLRWYANQTFDTSTKGCHALALQNKVSPEMVDFVLRNFEAVDTDKSGFIDMQEFEEVLYKIMRIPQGVELPASRVMTLWMELETSGDSKVSFEEFLPWWLRRKDTLLPYEGFYASIRRVGEAFMDPPAYESKAEMLVV